MAEIITAADGPNIQREGTPFVKRHNPVWMERLEADIPVHTAEGIMQGHVGDWLCYDPISGHVWVVADSYKEQHYYEEV
jgi:hypothetical protein